MWIEYLILITISEILSLESKESSTEYGILDGIIPTYLHFELFDNFAPNRTVTINVSLSRIEGTLLCTIDKDRDQLIVTLIEEPEERIKIELGSEEHFVTLRDLCGCDKCRYKPLELRFITNGIIYVQCNGHTRWEKKIPTEKFQNKAYPTTYDYPNLIYGLWLVNTPEYGEQHPNNLQLSGCIHYVLYNNKSMNLITTGKGVINKCKKSCDKNICNSGECYETFDKEPFCDCTNSFMNGPYCNSTGLYIENHQIISVGQSIQFSFLKLSWRSNSSEIVTLENKEKEFSVSITNGELIFYLCLLNENNQNKEQLIKCKEYITAIIYNHYNESANSSLILEFDDQLIRLKYISDNEYNNSTISVPWDLSKERFTEMSFLNGNGIIDAVYKQNRFQYEWTKIDLNLLNNKTDENYNNTSPQLKEHSKKNNWKERGYKFQLIKKKGKTDSAKKPPISNNQNKPQLLSDNSKETLYQEKEYTVKVSFLGILSILTVVLVSSLICLIVRDRKGHHQQQFGHTTNAEENDQLMNV